MATGFWINILTEDVGKSKKFYSQLGFRKMAQADTGDVAQFAINDTNSLLNLIDKKQIPGGMPDIGPPPQAIFIIDTDEKAEVDDYFQKASKGRGRPITPPRQIEAGYECVFADPDGYKWKVLYRDRKQPLIKSFFDGQDNQKDMAK
jgi:predicted lactoylglutathione lyase